MQDAKKLKGRMVVIIFLIILILPVSYVLIRQYWCKDTEVKKVIPQTGKMIK